MKNFRISKIEWRLFARIFFPAAAVLVIFAVAYCYVLYWRIEATFISRVENTAQMMMPELAKASQKNSEELIRAQLDIVVSNVTVSAAQYSDGDLRAVVKDEHFTGDWDGCDERMSFDVKAASPSAKLQICYLNRPLAGFLQSYALPAFFPMTIIAFLFTLFALLTVRYMLVRPLLRLNAAVRENYSGDFIKTTARNSKRDEIDDLAASLGVMSSQLFRERHTSEMAFQTHRDGIAILDSDRTILRFNGAFQKLLKIDDADVLNRKFEDAVPVPLPREGGVYIEVDREDSTIEVGYEPLNFGNEIDGRLVIVRDLTPRKILEAERMKNEKMTVLGTLSSGVAHDFNNLLSGVMGAAEVIQIKHGELLPEHGHKMLETIQVQVKRGKDLTQKLTNFSNLRQERLSRLDFADIVQQTVDVVNVANFDKVKIGYSSTAENTLLFGSAGLLQGLVFNICKNSVEAIDQADGIISISLSNQELSDSDIAALTGSNLLPGEHVVLRVEDNGHGIPKEIEHRVFDPFFTTKDTEDGSGLGLSAVDGVMQDHKGHIILESEPGVSTVFTIYLPTVQMEQEADPVSEIQDVRLSKNSGTESHVLVVEDEATQRDVYAQMLHMLGFFPMVAENGRVALELIAEHDFEFDLILLDVNMPEMNALELIKHANNLVSKDKYIIMTGFAETELFDKIDNLGPFVSLKKPFDLNALADAVKRVSQRRSVH